MFGDELGGTHFAIGQFRVFVDVPTPSDDLCFHSTRRTIDIVVHIAERLRRRRATRRNNQ